MLGLACKAGKVVSGEFAVEKSVKSGAARLTIVAEDASDNTVKMFSNKCSFYEIPIFQFGMREELGHAIGKEFRASLAVTDDGFAKSLMKQLEAAGYQKIYVAQQEFED